ncbi:hypothetical protein D3C72_2146620 [compost metagenome]
MLQFNQPVHMIRHYHPGQSTCGAINLCLLELCRNTAGGLETLEYRFSIASNAGQQVIAAGLGEAAAAQAVGGGTVHVVAP